MSAVLLQRLERVTAGGGRAGEAEAADVLRLRRAWPRKPGHLLVEYVAGDGERVAGQWFGHPDGSADRDRLHHVAASTARAAASHNDVVTLDEHGLLLQRRGADRRLHGLAELLARRGAALVAHRPERRAVVRLTGAQRTDYVKVMRPGTVDSLATAASTAAAARGVTVPALLDVDAACGWTTWEGLAGRSLHDMAADSAAAYEATAALAGRALRALHAVSTRAGLPVHDGGHEAGVLTRWLQRSAAYRDTALAVPDTLADGVRTALSDHAGPRVVIHRDFHDKHLLDSGDGRAGMLDVDTLSVGEAALDLANVLVHLQLRALQGRVAVDRAQQAAAALLAAYQPDASVADRLQAYADGTRLRLVCVYAFRPAAAGCPQALLAAIGTPVPGYG